MPKPSPKKKPAPKVKPERLTIHVGHAALVKAIRYALQNDAQTVGRISFQAHRHPAIPDGPLKVSAEIELVPR